MSSNPGQSLGMARKFQITADGGSRGNPGPAAYGAVISEDGQVIEELFASIGIASNNVAEYSGLIAGLRRAHELDPDATIDVQMDSKLVIEQMSGRWQIKHPDMRKLASEARSIHPMGLITFGWIPREANSHADRLANKALDGETAHTPRPVLNFLADRLVSSEVPTTFLFVRHGETPLTPDRRFSGIGAGDPELTETGIAQAQAVANEVALRKPDILISSPLMRTRMTAKEVAATTGLEPTFDEQWVELDFGAWDGLVPSEAKEQFPDEWEAWIRSPSSRPPQGESYVEITSRVEAGIKDLVERYPGQKICIVAHNMVIRAVVAYALCAPVESMYHIDVLPCSITTVAVWPSDGLRALKSMSERAVTS